MKAKRFAVIAVVVFGMVMPAAGAVPTVLFSNFDHGDGYHDKDYVAVGYYREFPFGDWIDVDAAMAFTVTGRDYYLTTIEVALSLGMGRNEVDIVLMSDAGGKPGKTIESIHVSGEMKSYPGVYPPIAAKSKTQPRLVEGEWYWVVVSGRGPSEMQIAWHDNTVGYAGFGAQRESKDKPGAWVVGPKFAATFRVKGMRAGPIIYVDKDATGNNNGSSWTHAYNKLQDGLAAAAHGDDVWLAEGVYRPDEGGGQTSGDREAMFELVSGVSIMGGFAGVGEPEPDARDAEGYKTVLSGDLDGDDAPGFANNGENSYHVVTTGGTDSNAVVDGVTVTGGNATGAYPHDGGGGVWIKLDSTIFVNCTFIGNMAGRGGGVSNRYYASKNPSFINCKFLGNSAGVGGGMESQGGAPTLVNCVFSGNEVTSSGGGFYNMGTSNAVLINCTLNGNSAGGPGGAIWNSWATASVSVLNCILWDNTDTTGSGQSAQIHNVDGAVPVDYSCIMGWDGSLGGTGNIGGYPMFVDDDGADDIIGTEDDDLHLSLGSPCIDTGHPGAEYEDSDGSRNDMGAYGGPSGDVGGPGSHSGTGFIFTSVGNIPISEIDHDELSPSHGMADVNALMAPALGIPAYVDTPFARTLWLHGLFGEHDDVNHYEILVGKWDGASEPEPNDYVALTDSLTKVRYFIDPCHGTWTYEYVSLGPKTVDEIPNLYELTDTGYWSHIDLRVRWNTRRYENGKYTVTHTSYRDVGGSLVEVTDAVPIDLVLVIDNSAVDANIHEVRYDPCSPYYDPAVDGNIPECGIINLDTDLDNLQFIVTAWHPNGYLLNYKLTALYGKNKNLGYVVKDQYVGSNDGSPPHWHGVMYETFDSIDAMPVQLKPWKTCAYGFRLRVWARTTNGFGYVGYDEFYDHYYLNVGSCAWCGGADINHSGRVDWFDFAALAARWLEPCVATCE